jgi:hypothetical protein
MQTRLPSPTQETVPITTTTMFSLTAGLLAVLSLASNVACAPTEGPLALEARQNGGFNQQYWANEYAELNYTNGAGGKFALNWDNNPGGNFVVGKGYKPGGPMSVNLGPATYDSTNHGPGSSTTLPPSAPTAGRTSPCTGGPRTRSSNTT